MFGMVPRLSARRACADTCGLVADRRPIRYTTRRAARRKARCSWSRGWPGASGRPATSAKYVRELVMRMLIAQWSGDLGPRWTSFGQTRWVPYAQRCAVAHPVSDSDRPAVDGRASGDPLSGWSSRCVSAHA